MNSLEQRRTSTNVNEMQHIKIIKYNYSLQKHELINRIECIKIEMKIFHIVVIGEMWWQ